MSKLAINGGESVRRKPFPLWPIYGEKELKAVEEVIKSRHWGRLTDPKSSRVKEFENRFARYHDAKYGIAVANGTAALEVALKAGGVEPGDEVIVPAYTFITTATAALQVGAIPIFVDIRHEDYNIDPEKIEEAITDKTRAIIPVHFAGYPADMDKIMNIAKRYNLLVIEDSAHAHGAIWRGVKVGSIGDMGTFSFQESKNITCGEGGIIITNNEGLARKCFSYHHIGRVEGRPFYEHHVLAWNYRMTEFQGAVLLAQLEKLEKQIVVREKNANYLSQQLIKIGGLSPVAIDSRVTRRVYHLYIFKYDKSAFSGLSRERFIDIMNKEGIPISSGYPIPLYKNPLFVNKQFGKRGCPLTCKFYGKDINYTKCSCPVAEKITKEETLWLMQNVFLGTKEDMNDIIMAIKKIKDSINELKES